MSLDPEKTVKTGSRRRCKAITKAGPSCRAPAAERAVILPRSSREIGGPGSPRRVEKPPLERSRLRPPTPTSEKHRKK
jgi:hypothetical protein